MWASRRDITKLARRNESKVGRDDRAATGDPVSNRAGASGWRSISIA